MTNKSNYFIVFGGIILISLVVLCLSFYMVKNTYPILHGDEVFTFGSSNSQNGCIIEIPLNKWSDRKIWDDYMGMSSVEMDKGINVKQVVSNQAADVHPPIYYILFRVVSCIVGKTSVNMGYYINVAILICCIPVLWGIARKLIDVENELKRNMGALISTIICTTCFGLLQQILFIRMYPLLIFFSLLDVLIHLELEKQTDNKRDEIALVLAVLAITIAGSLTHYYYLIFAFFESLWFVLLVLHTQRLKGVKKTILYSIVRGGAVLLAWRIYRPMSEHLLRSSYSNAAKDKAFELKDVPQLIKNVIGIFTSNYVNAVSIVIVLLLCGFFYRKINKEMGLLTITSICYLITVARVSPGQAERYFVTGYVMLLVVLSAGSLNALARLPQKRTAFLTFSLVLSAQTILMFCNGDVNPVYKRESKACCDVLQPYSNEQCIYISDGDNSIHSWDVLHSYNELYVFDRTFYTSYSNLNEIKWEEEFDVDKGIVVFVDSSINNDDALDYVTERMNKSKEQITLLYNHFAANAYIIS
ncbi:hypothetical protein SAMN02910368_01875 [Lachnospiraceae bacterium G11]|nr:hypothetical protein SAMN02910368_01875 [Lachnospiraceae bacterium G11]